MVRAYRGGYLPEERREIERKLFNGELLGVTTTTALELGIDIGSLDACLLVGYPGSIASMWQQAGRAGRRDEEALTILIGHNSPIDQYLMQHPEYLFGQPTEHAIIDPTNPHIAAGHLRCAAAELPIGPDDRELFGEYLEGLMEILEEHREVVQREPGRYYWTGKPFPARDISLRNMDEHNYVIQDEGDNNKVIGMVDEFSAFTLLHDEAIYLHNGETHFVSRLDLKEKIAYVKRDQYDYYTQAIDKTTIRLDSQEEKRRWRVSEVGLGEVTVTTLVYMFRKIKFFSRDSIGFGNLNLPARALNTIAVWLTPPSQALARVREYQRLPEDGLLGIANAACAVLPLFVMCDPMDIGAVADSSQLGSPTIFIYDKYPEGLGFAEKAYELVDQIMEACLFLLQECQCEEGCPSCVGSPIPGYYGSDQDTRGKIPDKEAALCILHDLLQREPYVPKPPSLERLRALERELQAAGEVGESKHPIKRLPAGVEKRIRERLRKLKQ
jgi:DEAD/DEAH box helicase domain-containing protein